MKSWILGILGGGQLGRMSALAAARLGIDVHVFTPEENSPAGKVAARTIVADYTDENALKSFADGVDVITYEFENIPVETVRFLKQRRPVYPDEKLLGVSQNRIDEKTYLNSIGIETTTWQSVKSPAEAKTVRQEADSKEFILKTARFGYDGKGQIKVSGGHEIDTAWNQLPGEVLIMEELVDFTHELSVIVARDLHGKTRTYGPMLNEHKNHILHKTIIPAPFAPDISEKAKAISVKLAEAVDLRGVLTLEMFLARNGELLANEIAPRTHNSGHWSIDACACSQFENHVRAVCGLPLGDSTPHSGAEMTNLIGHDIERIDPYLERPGACVHLYGKDEVREGRKMGHVTILKDLNKEE